MKIKNGLIYFFLISLICMSCKIENNLLVRVIGKHYYKKWFFSHITGNEITTIPYELINGWIVIKVKLNEQKDIEHRFVFDTGAITMIEPEIAKQLNLVLVKDFTKTDLNGVKHPASLINLQKLTIGTKEFLRVGALSSHTDLFKCYDIKGIFGYNLMDDAIFHINFKNQTIQISPSNSKIDRNDFYSVKIETDWRRIMYLILETDQRKIKAVLDTGAPNYIFLNNSLKSEFDLGHILKKKLQYINAANSSILDTISIYRPHNLKLGSLEIDKDVFVFSDIRTVIGKKFLTGFEEVILNAKKHRLYLSKKEVVKQGETKLTNLNIGWMDGAVRITGLAIDSSLGKIGIKIGDEVVSINDISTSFLRGICDFKIFESSIDIYKKDSELTILRDGQRYNYSLSKAMMYE